MKLFQLLTIGVTTITLAACAAISTPEGGPKDLTPPTLISSTPQDQQLNVKGNTISLTFDEEIQPNKLKSELLITPNTENKYEIIQKREQLTLEFEKPFQENTTYTFNFRNGIQDITEKNKASGLKISFSTGSYIDSSKVSGTVVNLLTQIPQKEAVVALYPTNDTLSVRKNRPYYQTMTDEAGLFSIENIKEGRYNIYAIVDKNNNAYYDNEEEKIAYLDSAVYISAKEQNIKLSTIKIDTKKPILLQRENFADRFIANYNEGIKEFTAVPEANANDTLAYKVGQDGKAISLFKTLNYGGGKTILSAVDSAGNLRLDTVQINFQGKRSQFVRGANLKVINKNSSGYRLGQQIIVELQTPVKITGAEPINILSDSVVIHKINPENLTLDKTATELSFKLPDINGKNKNLSLVLDSTVVVPLEGEPLQFTPLPLTIVEGKGTGSIKGSVTSNYSSYTIQLLDKNFNPVQEVKNGKTFTFKNLMPETYQIRVLVDENNDGQWYSGDPNLKKEPEKVYLYKEPIQVRANWEVEDIQLEF